MTEYLSPEQFTAALEKYKGADAQLWLFSVSLKRLVIRLYFRGERDDLFIVCVSCEHIKGAFVWRNANIFIADDILNDESNGVLTRVIDREVDFELVCSGGITMVISSDNDMWKSF